MGKGTQVLLTPLAKLQLKLNAQPPRAPAAEARLLIRKASDPVSWGKDRDDWMRLGTLNYYILMNLSCQRKRFPQPQRQRHLHPPYLGLLAFPLPPEEMDTSLSVEAEMTVPEAFSGPTVLVLLSTRAHQSFLSPAYTQGQISKGS